MSKAPPGPEAEASFTFLLALLLPLELLYFLFENASMACAGSAVIDFSRDPRHVCLAGLHFVALERMRENSFVVRDGLVPSNPTTALVALHQSFSTASHAITRKQLQE